MRRAHILGLLGLLALLATAAGAEIYRWTDADGVPHFSDRLQDVPPEHRPSAATGRGEATSPPSGGATLNILSGLDAPTQKEGEPASEPGALDRAELEQQLRDGNFSFTGLLGSMSAGALASMLGWALVALGVGLALSAVLLILAFRICGEEAPVFGKAVAIVALQSLAAFSAGVLFVLVLGFQASQGLIAQLVQFATSIGVYAAILRGLAIESFPKAVAITLVSLLLVVVLGVVVAFFGFCAGVGVGIAAG